MHTILAPQLDDGLVATLKPGGLQRVGETRDLVLVRRYGQTVYQQLVIVWMQFVGLLQQVGYVKKLTVLFKTGISLFQINVELLCERTSHRHVDVGQYSHACSFGIG